MEARQEWNGDALLWKRTLGDVTTTQRGARQFLKSHVCHVCLPCMSVICLHVCYVCLSCISVCQYIYLPFISAM